jgi:hypothetical protein
VDDLKDEAGTAASDTTSDETASRPPVKHRPLKEVGPESEVRGGPEAPDEELKP